MAGHKFTFDGSHPVRLDRFLYQEIGFLSRTSVKKDVLGGFVKVNGGVVKPSHRLKKGDKVVMRIPDSTPVAVPGNIPPDVIYENKDFLVINKPKGVVVDSSLAVNEGLVRGGIVHRLDKDTSGCLILAKNDKFQAYISGQFKDRKVKKVYTALVKGKIEPKEGTIEAPVGRSYRDRKKMSVHTLAGRNAVTHYKVLKYFKDCTLLEIKIETGRTHQIRVHLSAIGYPIVGDTIYGDKGFNKNFDIDRQFLHAQKIGFVDLKGEAREFEAPLPNDLEKVLELL
ncbi:RluA family pseudouridine synthase [Patescibacteria group bacterium]|nr:RluA family pseudouridine synthase [Patescibacteria group bacterium]